MEQSSGLAGQPAQLSAVLWDTATATAKRLGPGSRTVAFTPDSRHFVLGVPDGAGGGVVKVYAADGAEVGRLAAAEGERPFMLKVSPDGRSWRRH